jgi:mycothiol synthase
MESSSVLVRRVEGHADLEAWAAVKSAVVPDEPVTAEQLRGAMTPEQLFLLAAVDERPVGCGLGTRSDDPNRGFAIARVLPAFRRRGAGSALLQQLARHVESLGLRVVGSRVDGRDPGSLAFAERFGFYEVNREVEQVRDVGDESRPEPPGLEVVSIAERPELLEGAYALSLEAYPDLAVPGTIQIPRERWLAEEATRPDGSFVALADGEVVGYAGLLELGDEPDRAEHGLTAVRSAWRRRGIATLLKRTQLAWAAENGVRQLITYTQRGNEGMRAVNERLGYVTTAEHLMLRAELPLTGRPA